MAVAGSTKWVADAVVATGGWLAASAGIFGTVESEALAGVLVAGLAGMVGAFWKIGASHSAMDKTLDAMAKTLDAERENAQAEREGAQEAALHAAERIDLLESKLDDLLFGKGSGR